jgi:glutathione S-transferase
MHPLASYCHKPLIALYENDTPFESVIVDLGDDESRAEFTKLWPPAKFPVLHDRARNQLVPESTIIIEYLAQHYPGRIQLILDDPDRARDTRLKDRFYDDYVQDPMQKIVGDRLRPEGKHDPLGVEQAKQSLLLAYGMIENEMREKEWAMGDAFTMADCAAAPALFYADKLIPTKDGHPHVAAYLERLVTRPSYARVLREAEPYLHLFPRS